MGYSERVETEVSTLYLFARAPGLEDAVTAIDRGVGGWVYDDDRLKHLIAQALQDGRIPVVESIVTGGR